MQRKILSGRKSQKPNPVIGLFFEAAMGLAQFAVAFDHTVTTTFGKSLTLWSAVAAVGSEGLALWSAVAAIGSQGLALWSAIATVGSQGLTLWSLVVTVLNQTFLFQTFTAAFSQGLTLWSAVATISGYGLAEYRVAGFHLRGSLVGSGQGESSAG
jgi:hypothetical protein